MANITHSLNTYKHDTNITNMYLKSVSLLSLEAATLDRAPANGQLNTYKASSAPKKYESMSRRRRTWTSLRKTLSIDPWPSTSSFIEHPRRRTNNSSYRTKRNTTCDRLVTMNARTSQISSKFSHRISTSMLSLFMSMKCQWRKQYPEIASDIQFPELAKDDSFFSSVFRISSANMRLWTHYDVCT